MVNVEPFTNCGEQEGSHGSKLAPLCALAHLERKGEQVQNWKHVHNLLGHSQQELRCELISDLFVGDLYEGSPTAVDLVGRDAP